MSDTKREILELIGRNEGYTVRELSSELDEDEDTIQRALEKLMECGEITSTPDWKYRRSRRSDTDTTATF